MKNYQIQKVDIDRIKVDQRNPRLNETSTQVEAINLMLKNQGDKIIALAEHIASHGLSPTSRPLIFRENGNYVSGDGNRRIIALKCMRNPSIVLDRKIQMKFKKVATQPLPRAVECATFNSRADALMWISLNHNGQGSGEGLISWGSAEKDRFHKTESIGTQIINHYVLANKRQRYNKTTMDRFFKYRYIKNKLNIILDDRNYVDFSEIRSVHTKLLVKKLENISVHDVYTAAKAELFYASVISATQQRSKGSATPQPPAVASIHSQTTVIPKDFRLSIKSTRTKDVFAELQGLTVSKFPNAAALLLRQFLEFTVNEYCEKHSVQISPNSPLIAKFKKSYSVMSLTSDEKKTLDGISHKSHLAHTHILNSYVHNPTHLPNADSLKTTFATLRPFFEHAYS